MRIINYLSLITIHFLWANTAFAQGSLTPPAGTPVPTMKTLDQVEARTPISQPGSFPILITQAGSYYLTGNITGVSNTDGIRINVSGVTIDLNGLQVQGGGGVSHGITAPAAISNVTIRNGVVRGWGNRGLNLENVTNARIEKVTMSGCGDYGARTGRNAVVRDSIFSSNGTLANGTGGILAGEGSALTHSVANANIGAGFVLSSGVTLTACSAFQNGAIGVSANSGCVVSECSAYNNVGIGINVAFGTSVVHCGVYDNGGDGIVASLACLIKDNSVYGNTGDNIQVSTDCLVINNTCTSAGFNAGDGAGIHVTGARNRIDGNNITLSDRGIDVDAANNTILNNTVRSNPFSGAPANYAIVAGNQVNILLTHIPETINIPATVTLSGDLTGVSGSNGLTIAADNVTVDLAGHALVGVAGSLDGVNVSGSHKNIVIKNGTIHSWAGDGIDAATSTNGQFDRLQLSDNTGRGIHAGDRCLVTDCIARNNTGGAGIEANIIAIITRCVSFSSGGLGIKTGDTSQIEKCNLNNNTGGGISVTNNSLVRENNCDFHTSVNVAGILVTGSRNRIESNLVTRNARGIDVDGANNLIIKNSASGNTTNYDIVAGNTSGTIVTNEVDMNAANNSNINISF